MYGQGRRGLKLRNLSLRTLWMTPKHKWKITSDTRTSHYCKGDRNYDDYYTLIDSIFKYNEEGRD